jgi:hypothetical protein
MKVVIIDIGKVFKLCLFRFAKIYVLSLMKFRELGSVVYRIVQNNVAVLMLKSCRKGRVIHSLMDSAPD